jgi:hypothetical protein
MRQKDALRQKQKPKQNERCSKSMLKVHLMGYRRDYVSKDKGHLVAYVRCIQVSKEVDESG